MGRRSGMADELHVGTAAPFQIWDNGVAYTESCRGILDVGEGYIRLKLGRRPVTLWGDKLEVLSYTGGRLLIRGDIKRVEFDGSGESDEAGADVGGEGGVWHRGGVGGGGIGAPLRPGGGRGEGGDYPLP